MAIPAGFAPYFNGHPDISRSDLSQYGPSKPYFVSHNLVTSCFHPYCTKKEGLSRCAACKVVRYCSREHQTTDRPLHKKMCTKIKNAQLELEYEERELRQQMGNDFFTTSRGNFWVILETRDYMRARYALVEAQLKFNSQTAVQAALENLLDMSHLCRSDNMGLRYIIPGLFLRLGRDQECYDFIKWWATTGEEEHYDWGDLNSPFLDVRDADVFESVEPHTRRYFTLSHCIAVTLLKIRLLVDLQNLQRANEEVGPHLPQEIMDAIRQKSITSAIASNPNILERQDHTAHIEELVSQIRRLYTAIKESNKYFWPAVLEPGGNLTARPNCSVHGDPREMQLMLQYNYNSWAETPGAIGVIEELSRK